MTFGEKIRELRKAKNLSQRDLATKVRVNFTYISKIENEKLDFGDYPSEELILKLAKALEADADELLILAKKSPRTSGSGSSSGPTPSASWPASTTRPSTSSSKTSTKRRHEQAAPQVPAERGDRGGDRLPHPPVRGEGGRARSPSRCRSRRSSSRSWGWTSTGTRSRRGLASRSWAACTSPAGRST